MNYIRALKSYKNFYAFTYTCSILAGPYKQEMKSEGVFLVKKWTFSQRGVQYVQYQYFFILHFTYLVGGGVRTKRTPPADGPVYFLFTRIKNLVAQSRLIFEKMATHCSTID